VGVYDGSAALDSLRPEPVLQCRLMDMLGMITARTAGAAKKQLLTAKNRLVSDQGLGHALGQPAEAGHATEAGIDGSSMRKRTGISTETSQHQKSGEADRMQMSKKHAELFSLTPGVTAAVQGTGTTLGMADQIGTRTVINTIAAKAMQAGSGMMTIEVTAETLLTANAVGTITLIIPLLKVITSSADIACS